jgi:hypothetical protein
MTSKVLVFCAIAAVASAFAPARGAVRQTSTSPISMVQRQGSIFDKAVKDWAAEYPAIYNVGWGPTTKAERWNGIHDNNSIYINSRN